MRRLRSSTRCSSKGALLDSSSASSSGVGVTAMDQVRAGVSVVSGSASGADDEADDDAGGSTPGTDGGVGGDTSSLPKLIGFPVGYIAVSISAAGSIFVC